MVCDLIVAFLAASGVIFLTWCLIGLLLHPVFGAEMVTFLPAKGNADALEQRVKAYAWLRDGRITGGRLVIVDQGLSSRGIQCAEKLCLRYTWVIYCAANEAENYISY